MSTRSCCSHVRPPTPNPFAWSLICLTSSFVHRPSSGYGSQVMRETGLRSCWPSQAVHLHPFHPAHNTPLTHTHTHTHTQVHTTLNMSTDIAASNASSVSKWCLNTGFKLLYFHNISCGAEIQIAYWTCCADCRFKQLKIYAHMFWRHKNEKVRCLLDFQILVKS